VPEVVEAQVGPFSGLPGLSEVIGCLPLLIRGLLVRVQSGEPVDECVSACQMTEGPWRTTTLRGPSVVPLGSLTQRNRVGLSEPLLLRSHGPAIEQQLAKSSGLKPGEVAVITYVALHQPATIPDVASGVGHGYRWAQDVLADLRRAGLVVRWQSGPARFALTDRGMSLAEQMNAAVWKTISSAHGWPAAVITGKVMDLLSASVEQVDPPEAAAGASGISEASVAAESCAWSRR